MLFSVLAAAVAPALAASNFSANVSHYRPGTHYSPGRGFMNDPNGLLHDHVNNLYHLYYQYNPNGTVAGNQHWGHATSSDLLSWKDEEIALSPDSDGGLMFSGSMVSDANNTSGLFNKSGSNNLVAVYTRYTPSEQTQNLAFSTDGGITFTKYSENPVLRLNSSVNGFRDPQVFWYAPGHKWVMTVAVSRQHEVRFYESKDLRHWKELSSFTAGVLGVDYECPNLVEVFDHSSNKTRWVLFVSVNPGMPQGGSGTQYFVGDFNGTAFVPLSREVQFVDFGKDNYALQSINQQSPNTSAYIGWFGNWQYCQETPTEGWRGAMTYARQISLKKNWLDRLQLVQTPINVDTLRQSNATINRFSLSKRNNSGQAIKLPNTTAIELNLNVSFAPQNSSTAQPGDGRLTLELYNDNLESVQIGIDQFSGQLFVDRSNLTGFSNPFFTGQFSAALQQPVTKTNLRAFVDGSLIEVYAEGGFAVGSISYYSEEPLSHARVRINRGTANGTLGVYRLRNSVKRA